MTFRPARSRGGRLRRQDRDDLRSHPAAPADAAGPFQLQQPSGKASQPASNPIARSHGGPARRGAPAWCDSTKYVWLVDPWRRRGSSTPSARSGGTSDRTMCFGTVVVRVCDMPGRSTTCWHGGTPQCLVKALSDEIDHGDYEHNAHQDDRRPGTSQRTADRRRERVRRPSYVRIAIGRASRRTTDRSAAADGRDSDALLCGATAQWLRRPRHGSANFPCSTNWATHKVSATGRGQLRLTPR